MKPIMRISLEISIISLILVFLNNSFSQELKKTPYHATPITFSDLIGVTRAEWNAKSLQEVPWNNIYDKLKASGYTSGSNFFPIMGFNQKEKNLIPLTMTLKYSLGERSISSQDMAIIFASYRDSITASNDDLEKRITKLENKVAQIEKECCPRR